MTTSRHAPARAATHTVNPCPTPYAPLNAVLVHFVERVRRLLAGYFIGAYLQGSFALGDFDDKSDVDFVVVVERDVADADVPGLDALHTAIHEFPEPWGPRLEGSYIPAAVLRRAHEGSVGTAVRRTPGGKDAVSRGSMPEAYPLLYLDHGAKTLVRSAHDNTQVVRWVTREKGVVLAGPHPRDLIDAVSPEALRREMRETMHGRAAAWLADPAALDVLWAQAFAVGLHCRMLHTLETGEVTSKRAAAAWACRTLDARWHPLIAASVGARPSASLGPADPQAVAETRAFVRYALEIAERACRAKMTEITSALVTQLIRAQFPQWADLPVTPVENGGWDNRTFRLGDTLAVRLPSASSYVAQVDKEQRWLPVLRPHLPFPIPIPLGRGAPSAGYPWPWSIYCWLDGKPAHRDSISDLGRFAVDLAHFLAALRSLDARDGPAAGTHNFHRGGPLTVYDAQVRQSIITLAAEIDVAAVTEVGGAALATSWQGPAAWIHGDIAASNILVSEGRLCAVIDFGCMGVGDPSCDLVIAWTFFDNTSRTDFRAATGLDPATWARARGWAMWKALITLVEHRETRPAEAKDARRTIRDVLDDHFRAAP